MPTCSKPYSLDENKKLYFSKHISLRIVWAHLFLYHQLKSHLPSSFFCLSILAIGSSHRLLLLSIMLFPPSLHLKNFYSSLLSQFKNLFFRKIFPSLSPQLSNIPCQKVSQPQAPSLCRLCQRCNCIVINLLTLFQKVF